MTGIEKGHRAHMEYLYTTYYKVGYSETDCGGLCRISALMGFMQDAAGRHCDMLGFSRDLLIANYGGFWMIVRLRIVLNKPIPVGSRLELQTWHRGSRGVLWYRDFVFFLDGQPVGKATTAWVIAACGTRRILRPTHMPEIQAKAYPERTTGEELSRIRMPADLYPVGQRTVFYSDLDVNRHLNNIKYADILCDVLHLEHFEGSYISDCRINYLEECVSGNILTLWTGEEEGSEGVYCAYADTQPQKRCFEARLALSPWP